MGRAVEDELEHIRLNTVIVVNELNIAALGYVHQGISLPPQHLLLVVP